MLRHLTLGLALCAALSACGGGGSSSSALPSGPASAAPVGPQSVRISIKIPQASTGTASSRRVAYVSPGTKSASITVNGATPVVVNLTPTSANCSSTSNALTCSVTVSAPVSAPGTTDTFSETLYSGLNAQGNVLSTGKTSAAINAGVANTVSLTLSGVIASLSVAVNGTLTSGTASSIGVTVNFNDAAGDAIIGPGTFTTPVTLTDTDGSHATALLSGSTTASTLTLNQPSDATALSLSYNGATSFTGAVISAAAGSIAAPSVTVSAQPAPTPTPTQTPNSASFNDYVTFGYDNGRDVYNPNSTALTPTSVNGNLHLAWQQNIADYNTQTQPILATEIPNHAGVLFVGGGSGGVKAYDALSGTKIWNFDTHQETYTCENSSTIYFGVGGTVAYDPVSKSIYVVGNQNASPNAIATNSLYHLDAGTGAQLGVVNFAPPLAGWNSLDFSHTSVTLANGMAYVGTGATCDISSWRGRVAAISVPSMTLEQTFFTVWNGTTQPWGGGGVWGWGGVSVDAGGNVLTGVGNTDNGSSSHGSIVAPFAPSPTEYSGNGEALIKLPANLSGVIQSNHPLPDSVYGGNSIDLDLQGTPAIFTPTGCPTMAAVQGKSGTLFLYQENNIGRGPVGQFQLAPSSYQDSFLGGPAFSEASGLLYEAVPSSSGSLYPPGLIAINPQCGGNPTVVWQTGFGPDSGGAGIPRSVPGVSAGGVVFVGTPCTSDGNGGCGATTSSRIVSRNAASARRKPAICCAPPGSGEGALWALNASTGALLNGGEPLLITSGPIRVPPTIDGDWVFVLDNSGNMYGLTIDSKYPSVAETMRAVDSRMMRRWEAAPQGTLNN